MQSPISPKSRLPTPDPCAAPDQDQARLARAGRRLEALAGLQPVQLEADMPQPALLGVTRWTSPCASGAWFLSSRSAIASSREAANLVEPDRPTGAHAFQSGIGQAQRLTAVAVADERCRALLDAVDEVIDLRKISRRVALDEKVEDRVACLCCGSTQKRPWSVADCRPGACPSPNASIR